MTDNATPAKVRLNDELGPLPEYAHAFRPRWPGDEGGFVGAQMRLYAMEAIKAQRERIRGLVEAVRKANAESQDADDCLIYTPAVQRAWIALMAGLEGPNY